MHKYFVLCPIDKATKNVAIICKQFYLNNILEECETNNGIAVVTDKSVELINNCIHSFIKYIGIKTDSTNESLPTIFSSPKFHKPVLKFRCVISYSKCSIRPLAIRGCQKSGDFFFFCFLFLRLQYKSFVGAPNILTGAGKW